MIYTIGWIGWIAAFAVIEGLALADRRPGDTLSEHIWKWFRVKDRRPTALTWLSRAALYAGLAWLVAHLGFALI